MDAPTRIRDLDDAAFAERYRCDRFSATVLANRFGYIVEHMCGQLLTTAFSQILSDFYDFATFVLPAVRANAVGQLRLMAVRTLRKARGFQGIMGSAGGGPLGGVSTFRIRHFSKTSLLDL